MAEIKVERKKSVWPWILAVIVVALLLWALLAMLGRNDQAAVAPGTAAVTAPADTQAEGGPAGAALERYAGTYGSGNMQLNLGADGSYTMRESPAGEGQGRWTYEQQANVLHLTPADGSQERYFRVEGRDTLTPLNPDGQPAAQMAQLQRVVDR